MKFVATTLLLPFFAVLPLVMDSGSSDAPGLSSAAASSQDAAKVAGDDYTIDNSHSSVIFKVKHVNVSFSYGRFNELQGKYFIAKEDASKCSFEVVIDADSIDSNNPRRDRHLRSADFFNVKQFPKITLKSTKVSRKGKDGYEALCDLTMHGVTKSVTVEIKKIGEGPGPRRMHRTGFEIGIELDRSDYGMKWGAKRKVVGDRVQLWIAIEGIRR